MLAFSGLFACAGPSDSPGWQDAAETSGETAFDGTGNDFVSTTLIDARPAALVEGSIVNWAEMRPLLNEAAGAAILQEVILDRMLIIELARTGRSVTDRDQQRERDLLYETLSPDPDVAARLAKALQVRQGLGKRRFRRLLHRNASLRALIADDVILSEEAIIQTHMILHGPTRRARLMVLPSLSEAQTAVNRVRDGEFFGDVAVEISTDASASRGGLLAPISRADPTYPEVMRDALWTLVPGETSTPILLSQQYAVLMLVEEIDGDGVTLEDSRVQMQRQVRLMQQRLLMDQKARQLLNEASVTVIDAALKDSWDDRAVQIGQ
jgi:hypothetical protein